MLPIYPRCPVRLLSKAFFAERREDPVTGIDTIKLYITRRQSIRIIQSLYELDRNAIPVMGTSSVLYAHHRAECKPKEPDRSECDLTPNGLKLKIGRAHV